jgi:hypothetical protein
LAKIEIPPTAKVRRQAVESVVQSRRTFEKEVKRMDQNEATEQQSSQVANGCDRHAVNPDVQSAADEPRMVRLQDLLNCGLNAFAAELLGESLIGHPEPIVLRFTLPIRKGKRFNAVSFVLEPIYHSQGPALPVEQEAKRLAAD